MTNAKPWYLSRTIWASAVTVLVSAASLLGLSDGSIDEGAATDSLLQIVTGIAGIVAVYGRLSAKDRIG